MGGKVKQRTKGNTKPSSSGRAAELLSREGTTGFVGFGNSPGSSSDNSSLQFVSATTDPDVAAHGDFHVVMKKLTKRDAVTKLKAVQEFGELCKTSEMEAVLAALPYWPRLYNKLAMHVDYRVREATQHAMNQMASRVGRNLAPHLKSVMGVWLCSQCDTYSPVATAAQEAFTVAFSENKQAEVLEFCRKEIVEYLIDNLMNQTTDTLSDPKLVEEKDRFLKFIRVISSSLLGLGKFIMSVGEEVNTEMEKYSHRLLTEKKFWKLGRHKSPQIRASLFSLVTIYCQKLPGIANSFSNSLCPIVLGSIDDQDVTVSNNLWQAVLQVVTTIQDCWQCVNIEKAVLPKFWKFLSNGAYGNGAVVMVSLLPFLSKLPDQIVSPGSGFSQKMFSKLIEGLNQVKVQQSPSECKAIVSALMDCVIYVVLQRTWNIEINKNDVCQLRIDVVDQLITVLDLSFSPKSNISSSSLYHRLRDFLCVSTDLDDMTSYFWDKFSELIFTKLQDCSNKANRTIFQWIVKCLCCLKSPGVSSGKAIVSTKVRFKEDNMKFEEKEEDKVGCSKEKPDVDVNLIFGGKLLDTVKKSSQLCVEHVLTEKSESHLFVITQLVKEFCSIALLKDLLTSAREKSQEDLSIDNISGLSKHCINMFVLPLIGNNAEDETKDRWLISLVEMLFILMGKVGEDDQTVVLKNIFQVNSSLKVLYFIVNEVFKSNLFDHMSEVHGLEIGRQVVRLSESCLRCSDQENDFIWKIFHLCFTCEKLLGFFFTRDLLNEIFGIFHNDLNNDNISVSRIHSISLLIEKFIQNIEMKSKKFGRKHDLLNNVVRDILRLRILGCSEQSGISQCCQSLIQAAHSDDDWLCELTKQTIQIIKLHLHSNQLMSLEKHFIFIEASIEIIKYVSNGNHNYLLTMIHQLIPSVVEWDDLRDISSHQFPWHVLPFLDGKLFFDGNSHFVGDCVSDIDQFTAHHRIALFVAHTLKDILPPVKNNDEDERQVSEEDWKVVVVLELLWMKECLQRTSSPHKDNILSSLLVKYNASLQPLVDRLSFPTNQPILLALFHKSLSYGGLWSLTLKSFINEIQNKSIELQLDILMTTCEGYHQPVLQTLQCLISEDTLIYNMKVIVELYGKKWKNTRNNDLLGHMFCLSVLACAFERWIFLTKDSVIGTLECRLTLLETMDDIRICKGTMEAIFLFSCCLDDVEMYVVSLNMAIIRLFHLVVTNYAMEISGEQWDMILCSMLDWLQSCNESNLTLIRVTAFTNHVCQLIKTVCRVLCNDPVTSLSSIKPAVVEEYEMGTLSDDLSGKDLIAKLSEEWREFFSNSVCNNLLRLISTVSATVISNNPQLSISLHRLSESLSSACVHLTVANFQEYTTSKLANNPSEDLKWQEHFLREFTPNLVSHFSAFQVASYRSLRKVVPILALNKENRKQSSEEDDDPFSSPPDEIISVINNGQSKLHSVFLEVEVPFGETLIMTDDVELLHISRSFFLAWKLLLEYFVNSPEECRVGYANYLRRGKHLTDFLEIVFRMMPRKQVDDVRLILEGSKDGEETFLLNEEFVHGLAFEVYYDLIRTLPALVRQWWNNLDKMKASIVERYTASKVSPLLCKEELQAVQRTSTSCDNMEIVTRSSTREVIAYYKIEDISIELIVSLSANHPLGVITVNCGKAVGVRKEQWKLWMMQLTMFLMQQNGSIIEGLMLWKRNVDKKFEGVDDCMICFSVIHGSNYSLPKLCCKTCKKRFHSACLYRWFNTSNNSTCPLCRNLF